MSEAQELKRAIIMEKFDRAEKLLRVVRQTGQISPSMAAQIQTYLTMARWETTPDKETASRLKVIISAKL